MTAIVEWMEVGGPLGFPSSKDYRYWIPTLDDGTFRAWYFPTGLPDNSSRKLGDHLDSLDEAKRRCEEHERDIVVHTTRGEIRAFLDSFGPHCFIDDQTDMRPVALDLLADEVTVVFSVGRLVFQDTSRLTPGLLTEAEVREVARAFYPHVPLGPVFRRWRAQTAPTR